MIQNKNITNKTIFVLFLINDKIRWCRKMSTPQQSISEMIIGYFQPCVNM